MLSSLALAGAGACLPAAPSVDLPRPDAVVSFAVRHTAERVLDVRRVAAASEGEAAGDGPIAYRAAELVSILQLGPDDLRHAHPASRLDALGEVTLRTVAPTDACEERVDATGTHAEVDLPEGVPTWRWTGDARRPWAVEALPAAVSAQLRLRVPLAACDVPLRLREFTRGGSFSDPFEVDGVEVPLSALDPELGILRDAAQPESDLAVAVTHRALLLMKRGERLRSTRSPGYMDASRLAELGHGGGWVLRTVAAQRPEPGERLSIFLVATRPPPSGEAARSQTLAVLLSHGDDQLQVQASTVSDGLPGPAGTDLLGRFFAALSFDEGPERRLVIFGEPAAEPPALSVRAQPHLLRTMVATPWRDWPHAAVTHGASRLILGDLFAGVFAIDEEVPREGGGVTSGALGLATFEDAGARAAAVTTLTAEYAEWREGQGWTSPDRHFDLRSRELRCFSNLDDCGRALAPRRLDDLQVLHGSARGLWLLSRPDTCPHLAVARLDGCSGVLPRPASPLDGRVPMLTFVRPSARPDNVLLGGGDGRLLEAGPEP